MCCYFCLYFFFSSRRRHTRSKRDWSSDVCSSDLPDFCRYDCDRGNCICLSFACFGHRHLVHYLCWRRWYYPHLGIVLCTYCFPYSHCHPYYGRTHHARQQHGSMFWAFARGLVNTIFWLDLGCMDTTVCGHHWHHLDTLQTHRYLISPIILTLI